MNEPTSKPLTKMGTHWAYVEWSPSYDATHDVQVEGDHTNKACRAKSDPIELSVECDVFLPECLRHAVSAESEDRAMALARAFALAEVPYGVSWAAVYIGEVCAPRTKAGA